LSWLKRAKISVGVYTLSKENFVARRMLYLWRYALSGSLVLKQIMYCVLIYRKIWSILDLILVIVKTWSAVLRLRCFDKCVRFRLFDIMFRYDLLWRICVGLYTRTVNIVSHSIIFCKLSSKTRQQFVFGNTLFNCF
jgi:hypothetical protein